MFSFGYFPGVKLSFADVSEELFIKPLKMDMAEGSETSAKHNLTPGKYRKEHIIYSERGESLKSRISHFVLTHHGIFTTISCSAIVAFEELRIKILSDTFTGVFFVADLNTQLV
jgi:hypothetical protein